MLKKQNSPTAGGSEPEAFSGAAFDYNAVMRHVFIFVEGVFKDGARPGATAKMFETEVRTWFEARSKDLQQAILREYKSTDELVRTLSKGLLEQNKEELSRENPNKSSGQKN